MPNLPEYLRSLQIDDGPRVTFAAQHGCMLADAIEIADVNARALNESSCKQADTDGALVRWWNVRDVMREDCDAVDQAVRYLEARGLLDRHPTLEHLVNPRSPGETARRILNQAAAWPFPSAPR